MRHERNALQQFVFPELESFCRTHRFQFQAIDLRWGVIARRVVRLFLRPFKSLLHRVSEVPAADPFRRLTANAPIPELDHSHSRVTTEVREQRAFEQILPALFGPTRGTDPAKGGTYSERVIEGRFSQWTSDLDRGGESAATARRELAAAGSVAIPALLHSVSEIDERLRGDYDQSIEIKRIKRRIEVLASIRDEQVVMPIIRTLNNTATLVASCRRQRTSAQRNGFGGTWNQLLLDEIESVEAAAQDLKQLCMNSLIQINDMALPFVERNLTRVEGPGLQALRAVQAHLLGEWWRFWLWL